ncbi:MAG: M4 family metallopeptidase [Actinomycetales bacterium]
MTRCRGIVPPYLLERLQAVADEDIARIARETLAQDELHRSLRRAGAGGTPGGSPGGGTPGGSPPAAAGPRRTIDDAGGTTTLPGRTVRAEGAVATGDPAADEAYDGLGATWDLYDSAYGRDSLDGHGLPLLASVHYGSGYDNAFWNGEQMVFGDGDGTYFNRFTIAVDVIGHELTHGVTEQTAGLTYSNQPGALNESVSDCFGSMVKQMLLGQDAQSADWLIGAGLFTAAVQGVALRSMKAPGTAYDDPNLGHDPQPATMDGYVQTTDDEGGVHINSGIPNHAFYLAAVGIGGTSWEGAGLVWYDVLTGGSLSAHADFSTFAGLTVTAARARFGDGSDQAAAVLRAWDQVKVPLP